MKERGEKETQSEKKLLIISLLVLASVAFSGNELSKPLSGGRMKGLWTILYFPSPTTYGEADPEAGKAIAVISSSRTEGKRGRQKHEGTLINFQADLPKKVSLVGSNPEMAWRKLIKGCGVCGRN